MATVDWAQQSAAGSTEVARQDRFRSSTVMAEVHGGDEIECASGCSVGRRRQRSLEEAAIVVPRIRQQ
jgi:hypothetical protein